MKKNYSEPICELLNTVPSLVLCASGDAVIQSFSSEEEYGDIIEI